MRLHLAAASLLLGLALSAAISPQRGRPDAPPVSGGGRKPAPVRPPPTGGENANEAGKAVREIVKTTSDLVQSVLPAQETGDCRLLVSAIESKVASCSNRALDRQRRDKCLCEISQGMVRGDVLKCALPANQNRVAIIMGKSKSLCQECRLGQKGC